MKNKFNILLYVIIALVYLALSHFNFEYYATGIASDYSIYVIIILFLISSLFIYNSQVSVKKKWLYKLIIFFTVLTFVTQITDILSGTTNAAIRNLLHILAIPIGFLLGQTFSQMIICQNGKSNDFLVLLLIFPIFYIAYRYLSLGCVDPDSLFFVILLFPLVFCLKKDLYQILLFILVGIIIAISAKRSILIAYGINLLLFICKYSFLNKGNSSKKIAVFIGMIVLICWFIANDSETINNIIFRFQLIEEDSGSGRTELYNMVLGSFSNSSFISQMFGHGYRSVISLLEGIPAHNDFLEILYDFGLVPLVVYCLILLKFVQLCFNRLRHRLFNNSTLMLCASTFNLIVLGSLNNIFVDTFFIFTSFLCLGISLKMIEQNH